MLKLNHIYLGNSLDVLKTMPAGSVDCVVTSPPYWGLRDYGTATWEGGDASCDHSSAKEKSRYDYDLSKAKTGTHKNAKKGTDQAIWKNICPNCGAKKIDGQLGLEETMEEYVSKLCDIFDEIKRVLKDTGVVFVNIGDTYWGGGNNRGSSPENLSAKQFSNAGARGQVQKQWSREYPSKSQCMIPFRFAIEMVNCGWVLRNTIIWHKKNAMPSSADSRFTVDFEYIYMFVKSNTTKFWSNRVIGRLVTSQPIGINGVENEDWVKVKCKKCSPGKPCGKCDDGFKKRSLWKSHDYFFEQQFEPHSEAILNDKRWEKVRSGGTLKHTPWKDYPDGVQKPCDAQDSMFSTMNPLGRNHRSVLTVNTQPLKEAHFATFPEKLIEPLIAAGCPERVCTKCGMPVVKIFLKDSVPTRPAKVTKDVNRDIFSTARERFVPEYKGITYASCSCNKGFNPGVVLDLFIGSGTTGVVAIKQGKHYVGIDLNPEYIQMANKRIADTAKEIRRSHDLFNPGIVLPRKTTTRLQRLMAMMPLPDIRGWDGKD